jgi:hypothetical protein
MFSPLPLVSLRDMLKVYAGPYVSLGIVLREVQLVGRNKNEAEVLKEEDRKKLRRSLHRAHESCMQLGMVVSAGVIEQRLTDYSKRGSSKKPITYRRVSYAFEHLEETIQVEVRSRWLLVVPQELASYYDDGPAPFGEQVATKFPSAGYDIREASKCLALGRETAAVFHLMRVLEKGLGALAADVGVPFEFENWKNIIDQIGSKITALDNTLPRGQAKSERLQFLSTAATNFQFFKEAWRNHVSHGRSVYNAEEAVGILQHVRLFMRTLAARIGEPNTP